MTEPKPTGARLRLLMRLRSRRALDTWRNELAKGKGVYAAAEALGVSKNTAYTLAREWPALSAVLKAGTMPIEQRAVMGGIASQAAAAANPAIKAKRLKAIRKEAKGRA